MNMRRTILLFIILSISITCYAGENFFGLTPVDFFQDKKKEQKSIQSQPISVENFSQNTEDIKYEENIWIEPIIGPDGKITPYVPPKYVLEFLNSPTEENAQEYLKWQAERMQRIAKAEAVLKKVAFRKERQKNRKEFRRNSRDQPIVADEKEYIAFFLLKGCPYCEQQKDLIIHLKSNYPDLQVDVFTKGYDQDDLARLPFSANQDQSLADALGLSKYPATLIIDKFGKKILFRGLITKQSLNNFLSELS